jgi:hypothetical protein
MQARQMLKGGGQITDFEGARAEAAYSAMEAAANTGDLETFTRAAADFQQAVHDGLAKLREAAGGGYTEGGSALTPGAGGSGDLYQKYGLTPAGGQ